MIVVHGLKTCDTCRKALKALRAAGHDAVLRDLRAEPTSAEEVAKWYAAFGSDLLNTRSTTWRGLSEAERTEAPKALMLAHPALVKRPVIVEGDRLLLGWSKETQAALSLRRH
ncbi:Regulatory protein spx [Jannaschia seosinensis]|uniref:Regulatory protein spx n=1 Tax=Jannaschia seosinensis TaxID=313367 RepID=A0A0M7B724_9RHOB|nr:ArsC/Spx/MgsR family protein [Jannaschia seosinensis]CUH37407.1 Regulatory protein spx [Jannaschia seosinensis]